MNDLVSLLNAWGSDALRLAGGMAWQVSFLVGGLWLLDRLLRDRVSAALRYTLWLLVLVKLLLPPSLAFPSGVGYWLGRATALEPAAAPPIATATVAYGETTRLATEVSPVVDRRVPLRWEGGLLLVWAAGALALIGLLGRRTVQVATLVREAEPAVKQLREVVDRCADRLGLRRRVRVGCSARVGVPVVCGFRSATLVLPVDIVARLAPEQLGAVVLHELLHVRRRDAWVHGVQALLQVVYWWHPLVWFANSRIRRTREEAVDEAVMVWSVGDDLVNAVRDDRW